MASAPRKQIRRPRNSTSDFELIYWSDLDTNMLYLCAAGLIYNNITSFVIEGSRVAEAAFGRAALWRGLAGAPGPLTTTAAAAKKQPS